MVKIAARKKPYAHGVHVPGAGKVGSGVRALAALRTFQPHCAAPATATERNDIARGGRNNARRMVSNNSRSKLSRPAAGTFARE